MKNLRRGRTHQGFTLIEVMIAVAIMGALSLLTYQTVRSTAMNRGKIQDLLSNETKLGDSLRVMEHDISRAFHYRNIHFEILKASREEISKANNPPATNPPAGNPPPAPPPQQAIEPLIEPPNHTAFVGRSETLYLTTLSNYRTRLNSKQSDQLTVGYALRNCPQREGQEASVGQCLFRSRKYYFEEDVDRNGIEDLVVENVESLKFRYFGDGSEDWMDRWVSTEGGEEFSRNKFPLAVEVALSLYTSNKVAEGKSEPPTLQRTIIVPIRFPNNTQSPAAGPQAAPGERGLPDGT